MLRQLNHSEGLKVGKLRISEKREQKNPLTTALQAGKVYEAPK